MSDECTIVEVFTIDRRGLLYRLARTLHDLQLLIRYAKIGTYLDQVVDVFYVTERDDSKPESDERLAEIRNRLLEVIASGQTSIYDSYSIFSAARDFGFLVIVRFTFSKATESASFCTKSLSAVIVTLRSVTRPIGLSGRPTKRPAFWASFDRDVRNLDVVNARDLGRIAAEVGAIVVGVGQIEQDRIFDVFHLNVCSNGYARPARRPRAST